MAAIQPAAEVVTPVSGFAPIRAGQHAGVWRGAHLQVEALFVPERSERIARLGFRFRVPVIVVGGVTDGILAIAAERLAAMRARLLASGVGEDDDQWRFLVRQETTLAASRRLLSTSKLLNSTAVAGWPNMRRLEGPQRRGQHGATTVALPSRS